MELLPPSWEQQVSKTEIFQQTPTLQRFLETPLKFGGLLFSCRQPHVQSAALCCQALLQSTRLQAGLWKARSCVVASRVVARGSWVAQKLRACPYSIAW